MLAQQRECADDGDLNRGHGDPSLDEEVLSLAFADRQDAGQATEKHVRGHFHRRPAYGAGENGEQSHGDDAYAGVQQQSEEHAAGRDRNDIGNPCPAPW